MPDVRTARFQKACGKPACRHQRKWQADAGWRAKNRDYGSVRHGKIRDWAAGYPGYWRAWRAAHPDYVQRNRDQTRERVRASRLMFAKHDAMTQDPVGYLEGLRVPGMFAKHDAMSRPVDGILTFLVRREGFAKHDGIDPTPLSMASS